MTYRAEVLADAPSIYAECEETTGTTLTDSSGNARPGTLVGGTALSPDGRVGRGILFDGIDDIVSFGTLVGTASPAFELWVRPTVNPTSVTGLLGMGAGTSPKHRIMYFTDRHIRFDTSKAASPTALEFLDGPILPMNVWTHVVCLIEGGATATPVKRILYDGVQVATVTGAEAIADLSGDIHAGQRDGANKTFAGYMDELAVYGSGLTVARAQAHYAARDATAPPAPASTTDLYVWDGAVWR